MLSTRGAESIRPDMPLRIVAKPFQNKFLERYHPHGYGGNMKRVDPSSAWQTLLPYAEHFPCRGSIATWKRAAAPIRGLGFHDLRHQAITEMAEAGASDATLMAVAGHMSRGMLEDYSRVRMVTKNPAKNLKALQWVGPWQRANPSQEKRIETLRHNPHHNHSLQLFRLFVSA